MCSVETLSKELDHKKHSGKSSWDRNRREREGEREGERERRRVKESVGERREGERRKREVSKEKKEMALVRDQRSFGEEKFSPP